MQSRTNPLAVTLHIRFKAIVKVFLSIFYSFIVQKLNRHFISFKNKQREG